jgi:hypothetical protein
MTQHTLIERSIHLGETLTRVELDALWTQANAALHAGRYSEAFGAVEALLVQADCRGNVCVDCLPDVRHTKCAEGRSPEMLQGLVDRIESLNWAVLHASR